MCLISSVSGMQGCQSEGQVFEPNQERQTFPIIIDTRYCGNSLVWLPLTSSSCEEAVCCQCRTETSSGDHTTLDRWIDHHVIPLLVLKIAHMHHKEDLSLVVTQLALCIINIKLFC